MRNYGLLEGLARRHEVHLLSFCAPGAQCAAADPLRDLLATVETVPQPVRSPLERVQSLLMSRLPDMAHRLMSAGLLAALARLLESHSFDVVQFEGIEMIPYLQMLLVHRARRGRPLLVFDDHNAEYLLQRRVFEADLRLPSRWPWAAYSFVQWQRLRRYESWACRQVDRVLAVSEPDYRALKAVAPEATIHVVPNGIDFGAYASYQAPQGFLPRRSLVFTGKMDFRPNVDAVLWFVDHVFPLIRQAFPDARFYVVGQRPHHRLQTLQGAPGITVTGWVPETGPYIASADVYVIPLRSGGGTRLKVLEAAALRRPIVSTTMGCDGFPVTSGHEVLLADQPQDFARHVVGLLAQPQQGVTLAHAALRLAAEYDWKRIVPRLEAAYAQSKPT
jgi:glycosyltransferase involved in cell wall biosynthesis